MRRKDRREFERLLGMCDGIHVSRQVIAGAMKEAKTFGELGLLGKIEGELARLNLDAIRQVNRKL